MPHAESTRELYEHLEKVAPDLDALARQAEIDRRPSAELAALLKRARIPMAKAPLAVGGFEITPAQQVDYFARIAYLNPTAGWIAFNQNGAAGVAGATLPDAGVERVFAQDSPLFAAVSAPTGQCRKVEGGYRVTGRWGYASGVDIAEWVVVVALSDEPPGPRFLILEREQVQIEDNWHVAALKGTGSAAISVEDEFVPDCLSASPFEQKRGGNQYFRLGLRSYVAGENLGFSLGVAQRMVHEITALARTKKRVLDPQTVGERGAFQQELGRTDAVLRASRAYMMSELDWALERAESTGEALSVTEQARVSVALAQTTEALIQAATRLFPYAGAGALHLDHPIQRCYRDLIGSGQHLVASNENLDAWGRALLEAESPA